MKRSRPDVKVMDAPSKPGTYLVHPVVGAEDHKPWARVKIFPLWFEHAGNMGILPMVPTGLGLTDPQRRDFQIKILAHHLQTFLNAKDPSTRPGFIEEGNRVELRAPTPDGRLVIEAYEKGTDMTLLQGSVDAVVIHDLMHALCPLNPYEKARF